MSENQNAIPAGENTVYLMSPMYDFVCEEFCRAMDCVLKDEDIEFLINCPGGSVFGGWTSIGRMKERTGKNNAKVYGHAASMGMFLLLFMDNVQALDVTKFLIHRADGYVENPDDQKLLDSINKDLRAALESRLDMEAFTKLSGCTMDDVFNGKDVKDVWLTAKEAKKVGLINDIIRISKDEMKAFNDKFVAFQPKRGSEGAHGSVENDNKPVIINSQIKKTMTREEFIAQNPALHTQIVSEAVAQGASAERERVQAWLAFLDYDKENVVASIKDPAKVVTGSVMAEMTVKITAAVKVTAINNDGKTKPVVTGEAKDKTEEENQVTDFEAQVKKANAGLKTKVL